MKNFHFSTLKTSIESIHTLKTRHLATNYLFLVKSAFFQLCLVSLPNYPLAILGMNLLLEVLYLSLNIYLRFSRGLFDGFLAFIDRIFNGIVFISMFTCLILLKIFDWKDGRLEAWVGYLIVVAVVGEYSLSFLLIIGIAYRYFRQGDPSKKS